MDNWLETKQLPAHFVSAAGLVRKGDRVLLVRSERRGWEIPGGIVEQGERILDGLKREILEESGITAEPECLTGIYQNLACRPGYGPLEGMTLPPTVNMVFICRYVSGEAVPSEECPEAGWFTPEEAERMITGAYIKKVFEDARLCMGKPHFAAFRKTDSSMAFVSDRVL